MSWPEKKKILEVIKSYRITDPIIEFQHNAQLLRYFLALLWESLLKLQLDFTLWRGLCTLSRKVFRRCLLHYNLDNDGSYDASYCNLHCFTLALSSCKEKSEQRFSSLCFLVLPLADTSDSLTWNSSGFSNFGEDRQYTELPPQDTRSQWEVGVLRPGSYCRYMYNPLQREQREGEWNPKASKGIVVQKGTTTWFYGEEIKLMYVNFQIKVLSVFLSTTHLRWVWNSNVFPGALLPFKPGYFEFSCNCWGCWAICIRKTFCILSQNHGC